MLKELIGNPPAVSFESYFTNLPDGLVAEFGVASGKSIRRMAAMLPRRTVYGFDSWQGLPSDWRPDRLKGNDKYNPPADLPSNVKLVSGLFAETLPCFMEDYTESVALIHLDADLYSSTKTVLDSLQYNFRRGTILIFDEIIGYDGFLEHEWKAFSEYLESSTFKPRCLGSHHREGLAFILC